MSRPEPDSLASEWMPMIPDDYEILLPIEKQKANQRIMRQAQDIFRRMRTPYPDALASGRVGNHLLMEYQQMILPSIIGKESSPIILSDLLLLNYVLQAIKSLNKIHPSDSEAFYEKNGQLFLGLRKTDEDDDSFMFFHINLRKANFWHITPNSIPLPVEYAVSVSGEGISVKSITS